MHIPRCDRGDDDSSPTKADSYDSNQLEHDMTWQNKRQGLEPEMECLLSDTTASMCFHVSYATLQEEPRRRSCSQRTITRIAFAPLDWASPQWTPTSIVSTVVEYRPFEAPLATRYTLFPRRFLSLQPMLTRHDVLQGYDPASLWLEISG
ncbi:hypothetical protein SPRG_16867 [Saprolegnia parasitica CBS 223.65]|uniref:Uncharacterized protein n=1 Tax=Saprolegnia parasitica (strain CBS 223.65) TaxID=695850 RepID=A0A067BSV9_SAPPC|nr:hypothetical protein SPRG_16867 [Saprolegnia parasitica CBS 223.65]KDO17702.1 hypothetical protein SPRG_16867 [Saprolegnia parasitica CBS 223.65]|eukprot:XP_012211591.1 hypothetical protein SPRG_16867 [Saprolegnia parasitica CBS 223.65]